LNGGCGGRIGGARSLLVEHVKAELWGSGLPSPERKIDVPKKKGNRAGKPHFDKLGFFLLFSNHIWQSRTRARAIPEQNSAAFVPTPKSFYAHCSSLASWVPAKKQRSKGD
jgi:hypothetical protein